MGRKKKEETVKLEKIEYKNKKNLSDSFYYLLGIVLSLVLIFSTEEFLSSINYLFVIIFSVIGVVKLINFFMDKEYIGRNYNGLMTSIMCLWLAMFIFKYGNFIFLQMLPVLVSFVLFMMAISSFTKYFDFRITGNLIVSIVSLLLGISLMIFSGSFAYMLFKIVGIYILIMVILDLIDYNKKKNL